jgi:hypothetical protein
MIARTVFSVFLFITTGTINLFSQTFIQPNYGIKSHATLEIKKIEVTSEKTTVWLTIENRISGGNFCADRNIFIIDPARVKYKLNKATGIPVCPDTHKFKKIGEEIEFFLIFPPLKAGTEWIDIIEDCPDNCFSFFGVTLDNFLNKRIEEAFILAEEGESKKAIEEYKKILSLLGGKNSGVEGGLYCDIISLLIKSGDESSAKEWYGKMVSSKAPRLDQYIKNLNSRGIKY